MSLTCFIFSFKILVKEVWKTLQFFLFVFVENKMIGNRNRVSTKSLENREFVY